MNMIDFKGKLVPCVRSLLLTYEFDISLLRGSTEYALYEDLVQILWNSGWSVDEELSRRLTQEEYAQYWVQALSLGEEDKELVEAWAYEHWLARYLERPKSA